MHISVHYGEIAIKKGNRLLFENHLISNIKKALKRNGEVKRRYGKIIVYNVLDLESAKDVLALLPGIEFFSIVDSCPLDIERIKEFSLKALEKQEFSSFMVECKRSNKHFKLKSMEINSQVGREIEKKLNKKVSLGNPDITLFIEIGENEAMISRERIFGIGGLPTGTAGKVVALISGGIDSPVAAFMMMKRGCTVALVHFYSKTEKTAESISKVERLAEKLNKVQLSTKLYLVPFMDLQKEIIKNVASRERMIVYRRYMMRIANLIAKQEKAKGIVTGDSVGQVASQTLNNLNCIYETSAYPVFTPLIGLNKTEITAISRKINTFDISIEPHIDCCSFMIDEHPEISAKSDAIQRYEKDIDEKLILGSLKKAEKKLLE